MLASSYYRMSDDDDKVQKLRKKLTRSMRDSGYTEFEIRSREEAIEFLYISFSAAGKHHFLIKQLPFLLEPDTMSEQDWKDYIDLSWGWFGLYSDSN